MKQEGIVKFIVTKNLCLVCGQEVDYEDTNHKCPDVGFSKEAIALTGGDVAAEPLEVSNA